MQWWDMLAGDLQRRGRESEGEKGEEYSDAEANRAMVYTREDLILAVTHLSSLNLQIFRLHRTLKLLVALVAVIAVKLFF